MKDVPEDNVEYTMRKKGWREVKTKALRGAKGVCGGVNEVLDNKASEGLRKSEGKQSGFEGTI